MIHFFIGTKAQLIKTAPVMLELQLLGVPFRLIDSGQHAEFTAEIRADLDLPDPDFSLVSDREDVATYRKAFGWLGEAAMRWAFNKRWIRESVFAGQGGVCVVHGDTASTLLGAEYALRAGLDVAHLEAGLRSFNLFDPFPEEWIRVRCMKRAAILFAPDDEAEKNLVDMKVKGKIVHTRGNTVTDALRLVSEKSNVDADRPYLLATFHRLETLRSAERMKQMVETLNVAAETHRVKFVMHKPTEKALHSRGLLDHLGSGVQRLPMQPYHRFIGLIKGAQCVLADGGSIQEECAALGAPLLILRSRSERSDGLNENAVFCDFNLDKVKHFLANYTNYVRPERIPDHRPSAIVAEELATWVGHPIKQQRELQGA